MVIDSNNSETGNRAMASVLLLYWHLLRENGITIGQDAYLDGSFNGFDFLEVQVVGHGLAIDEQLVREGAVVYLLCGLNDVVGECDEDFLAQPYLQKILTAQRDGLLRAIPEADEIADMVSEGEDHLDYAKLRSMLDQVFHRYVVDRFRRMLPTPA